MNAARTVLLLVLALALAGCAARRTPAPVVDGHAPRATPARQAAAPTPPVIIPSTGDYYVVKRGDTLYSIALEHGAEYREVAQWNRLDDPTHIIVGQRLRVTPPQAAAQVSSVKVPGRLDSRPLAEKSPKKEDPVKKAEPPRKEEPLVAMAPFQFSWPAKGRVLAEFAGPRRKGIDIDGRPGDPVVAAAAGRVTYIGSGIPGMGKLVVIKHENGFITVYAHNREILVKEQQAVARGQKIAEIGSTDADRPKLHFQIRKGASAVDPLLYLPKS